MNFTTRISLIAVLAVILGVSSYAFTNLPTEDTIERNKTEEAVASIEWLTWEQAVAKNKTNPKKIFIDVYTDWCGWCKRMDNSTFQDQAVIKYLNDNFYVVKLDAEMKRNIVHDGYTFKYVASGRRGYHELAATLLNNRLSFPSCVAMDDQVRRITIIPGYQDATDMLSILKYIGDNHYQTKTYKEYVQAN